MKSFSKISFAAAMLASSAALAAKTAVPEIGVLAAPPGITIEPLGREQGYAGAAGSSGREQLTYATSKGITLFTYDRDPPGRSICAGDCAKQWLPAIAPLKPVLFGDWSVITREDGAKQWAYKGHPLYTSVKDVDPGSWYGNDPAVNGPKRKNAAGVIVGRDPSYLGGGGGRRGGGEKEVQVPDDWRIAQLAPVGGIKMPVGFAIKEVQDAIGLTLVDYRKRTLYFFDGDPNKDFQPNSPWAPEEAPQLAQPVGDFGFVVRNDGVRQWTYKGKGLYTYTPDLEESYADGIGVDRHFDVVALYRYPVPANITFQHTPSVGKIVATDKGLTLYRREAHSVGQTHGLRRTEPLKPAVGRDIDINALCDDDCRKDWHPYPASPNQPDAWGQWTVYTHPDGFRQLAYQGYALWTNSNDKKPGDINGNDEYLDFQFTGMVTKDGERPVKAVDLGTPQDGPAALYWAVIQP